MTNATTGIDLNCGQCKQYLNKFYLHQWQEQWRTYVLSDSDYMDDDLDIGDSKEIAFHCHYCDHILTPNQANELSTLM